MATKETDRALTEQNKIVTELAFQVFVALRRKEDQQEFLGTIPSTKDREAYRKRFEKLNRNWEKAQQIKFEQLQQLLTDPKV